MWYRWWRFEWWSWSHGKITSFLIDQNLSNKYDCLSENPQLWARRLVGFSDPLSAPPALLCLHQEIEQADLASD
jgi:hypothetical protein